MQKEGKELHAGCRTPHGSSETIRQQIEELNCMQHQTRFSTLLSRRSLCGCTSLCLPCRASKSVSSHPLAWLKVARKTHVFHWTRSVTLSINKCVQASVRQLSSLLDLRRSSIYPLVSLKKSCTKGLESCGRNAFLRKIDTLSFGPPCH